MLALLQKCKCRLTLAKVQVQTHLGRQVPPHTSSGKSQPLAGWVTHTDERTRALCRRTLLAHPHAGWEFCPAARARRRSRCVARAAAIAAPGWRGQRLGMRQRRADPNPDRASTAGFRAARASLGATVTAPHEYHAGGESRVPAP
eukprot:363178-Chlamydomonas_euryale.AAC.2